MWRSAGLALGVTLALAVLGGAPTPLGPPIHAQSPVPDTATFAPDELLVQLADRADAPLLRAATLNTLGLQVLRSYPRAGVLRVRVPPGAMERTQRWLLLSGLAQSAEPNYRLHTAQVVPNDLRYLQDQAYYFDLLGAPDAWTLTTGSREVRVAVVDGAVACDHPDLAPNIWVNPGEIAGNGLDDDSNGYVDDLHGYDFVGPWPGGPGSPAEDNDPCTALGDPSLGDGLDQDEDGTPDGSAGHGTKVAGIIAAVGNNAAGVAGVAWRAAIVPVRVTTPEGEGLFSSLIAALEYATAIQADVVNISLTSNFLPESAQAAIDAAADAGLIIVAAAGNTGRSVLFPAALPNVIAVGASNGRDAPDARALFSPWGAEIDFVAPGVAVPSTDILPVTGEFTYGEGTGTSFSAPFVTGAVVLIRALMPGATMADVRLLLQAGAVDLPDGDAPNWDGGLAGGGRIHLGRSLAPLAGGPPAPPVIESATIEVATVAVEGQAPANSAVALSLSPSRDPIATAIADVDGHFLTTIPLSGFSETAATPALIAIATTAAGSSEPSSPVLVALPRDVLLWPGWNLVAWAGPPGPSETLLANLPAPVTRLFAWNGAGWDLAVPGHPLFRIAAIQTGQPVWVYVEGRNLLAWRQFRAPYGSVTLQPGWQLVTWQGPTVDIPAALAQTGADIVALFRWDAQRRSYLTYRPQQPALSALPTLHHFDAVWLLVGSGGGIWPNG